MTAGMAHRMRLVRFGLAACVVLAGCGGGGGGGEPPPPDPASPLALNADVMPDAVLAATSGGESLLQVGQVVADYAGRLVTSGSAAPITGTCYDAGAFTVSLLDRDGDGKVSAGDRVSVDLVACGILLLGKHLSGTMMIEVAAVGTSPASLRGTVDLGAGLSVIEYYGASPGFGRRYLGTLAVEWTGDDFGSALKVTSTGAEDLRLVVDAVIDNKPRRDIERLRAVTVSKTLQYDLARTTINLAFRYESEALGGSLTVRTLAPLKAYPNTYPDSGALEVAGAGAGRIRLTPVAAGHPEWFGAALDGNGDGVAEKAVAYGWADAVEGFLWWDGFTALPWYPTPYQDQAYQAPGLGVVIAETGASVLDGAYRLQITGEPAATSPSLQFRFFDGGSNVYADGPRHVPAIVEHRGAAYLVRPGEPLRHGRVYTLQVSSDGIDWNSDVTVTDTLGRSLNLPASLRTFHTPDTMHAVIQGTAALLDRSDALLQVSALTSTSMRPIVGYRWAQRGGTPLHIVSPQAASTEIRWGAVPPTALENIDIELTVTDSAGEVDTARFTVAALDLAAVPQVLYVRSSPGDVIGGGRTMAVSAAAGSFSAAPVNASDLTFGYQSSDGSVWWFIGLATADRLPLAAGAYENAKHPAYRGQENGLQVSSIGAGCFDVFGRFDVLEIETDAQGVISKLALDFEQRCDGATAPPLFGSLRINSLVPIRP